MSGEVVAFARERLATDPTLSSQALVELIAERFGVRVHRRSVERALARAERPNTRRGPRKARMTDARGDARGVERYEQLRSHALDGEPSGFRLGLALLERRGVAAWSRGARPRRRRPARRRPHESRRGGGR